MRAFADRYVGILNDGMLSLMISVGHRTDLFDAMADGVPATSAAIASRAALNERYVREWLGAMTTGRIVNYDPVAKTYQLPAEHAAILGRGAGPEAASSMSQFVGLLGSVESQIVACFRSGGGVPYEAFTDFVRLMADHSAVGVDARLLTERLPMVPGLIDRLNAGIDVADIGCGSGHAVNVMAAAFPNSRFVGYDFSDAALTAARTEADANGVSNARFVAKDVSALADVAAFDLITSFDAIHDQAHPDRVLAGIRRALRDDGVYFCLDIRASSDVSRNLEHRLGPLIYTVSTMHCMTVSLALGGAGLGTAWGEELAVSMLTAAGFDRIQIRHVDRETLNTYYIAYPAPRTI